MTCAKQIAPIRIQAAWICYLNDIGHVNGNVEGEISRHRGDIEPGNASGNVIRRRGKGLFGAKTAALYESVDVPFRFKRDSRGELALGITLSGPVAAGTEFSAGPFLSTVSR